MEPDCWRSSSDLRAFSLLEHLFLLQEMEFSNQKADVCEDGPSRSDPVRYRNLFILNPVSTSVHRVHLTHTVQRYRDNNVYSYTASAPTPRHA